MKKFLIIRFSSIGDIVLTTPVIRCIKTQLKDVEVHFITKKKFSHIVENNPYVDKVWGIEKDIDEKLKEFKEQKYDYIIDLHNNLRSLRLKLKLSGKKSSFNKLNIQKWILVRLNIDLLPKKHIVDRYMETVSFLGVKNDGKGLDFFIRPEDEIDLSSLPEDFRGAYVAFVTGSIHKTKQLPEDKIISICKKLNRPVILLGGKEEEEKAEMIRLLVNGRVLNMCGKLSLGGSASIIRQAEKVITNDTGLMHIASAFKKNIISVWGNTVPEFGMYPYVPESSNNKATILEVKGLACRPCSKLGYEKCPESHFKCMVQIDENNIVEIVNEKNSLNEN